MYCSYTIELSFEIVCYPFIYIFQNIFFIDLFGKEISINHREKYVF